MARKTKVSKEESESWQKESAERLSTKELTIEQKLYLLFPPEGDYSQRTPEQAKADYTREQHALFLSGKPFDKVWE